MEPLSLLAGAISQYIVPKALEKIGEKVGESAIAKSGESIQSVRRAVQTKMKATHTETALLQAQSDPTEANMSILRTLLVAQMTTDPGFAQQLQSLLEKIETRSPKLQSVLENVRAKGSAEIGDISQLSNSNATQIIGRNLGVGGDLKIGNISQES